MIRATTDNKPFTIHSQEARPDVGCTELLVECPFCGHVGPNKSKTPEQAITEWNHRVQNANLTGKQKPEKEVDMANTAVRARLHAFVGAVRPQRVQTKLTDNRKRNHE